MGLSFYFEKFITIIFLYTNYFIFKYKIKRNLRLTLKILGIK
ncbi:hypothetical protein GCM10008917_09810 [Paraclostridium tenue]|uniref:Uncharacterized protein n=1 Tax=Paraclostridium tenue TaxID=1737 RepID=A0ABN1M203_9FIRM